MSDLILRCTPENFTKWHREEFLEEDRPLFTGLQVGDAPEGQFCLPWNYDKEWNVSRDYPLLILIGGSGIIGSDIPTLFNDSPSIFWLENSGYYQNDFGKDHPSFVYLTHPDEYYNADSAAEDVATITYIQDNYRVDESQIYISGFSMGGAGVHWLANALYDEFGHKVTNLIRGSGASESTPLTFSDPAVNPWFHNGLDDSELRQSNMQAAWSNFKGLNPGGSEESYSDESIGAEYPATHYLYRDPSGELIGRYTDYEGLGHLGGRDNIYDDPDVMDWLFQRRS